MLDVEGRSLFCITEYFPFPLHVFSHFSLLKMFSPRPYSVLLSLYSLAPLYTADSFLVRYCDSVLKQLPDIKTVVTVRQQLLSGGAVSVPRSEEDSLSPQERSKNAGIYNASTTPVVFKLCVQCTYTIDAK